MPKPVRYENIYPYIYGMLGGGVEHVIQTYADRSSEDIIKYLRGLKADVDAELARSRDAFIEETGE